MIAAYCGHDDSDNCSYNSQYEQYWGCNKPLIYAKEINHGKKSIEKSIEVSIEESIKMSIKMSVKESFQYERQAAGRGIRTHALEARYRIFC